MRCGTSILAVKLRGKQRQTFVSTLWTFRSMRRLTLRTSNVLDREPTTILFSTEALRANLLRLQNEWEAVQASRDRAAIYGYLTAVFETVMWWAKEDKAIKRADRALHLRHKSVRKPEPFAAVIYCTSDPDKADGRMRSKWSRALRFAAEFKPRMSRSVTSSSARAESTNARRGLLVVLGEVERIAPQHMRSGETVAPNDALA